MRILQAALWSATVLALAGTVLLGANGIRDPHPRDPVEVAILEQAMRMTRGESPYVEPADETAPALMPGLPFAVSCLARRFEPDLWEARLVDLLSVLLAAALAFAVVRAETGSGTLGAAAAGFLLLGLALAGRGAAGVHAQDPMLLLALSGAALLRFGPGLGAAVAASLVMAAACFTHPAGLWFAFAALFHLAVHDRRRFAAYGACLLFFVAGGQVVLSQGLGPWFDFQAWGVPVLALRFVPLALVRYLGGGVLGTLGVLTLAAVLSFALPVAPWRGAAGVWTWTLFAAVAAGAAATQGADGGAEALRPAMVALAVAGPVAIQRVARHLAAWPGSTRLAGRSVVLAAIAIQYLTLAAQLVPALRA